MDPEAPGLGIITERDLMISIGNGENPDSEMVSDHLTANLVYATPEWSLEQAAVAMVRGGFRHLVVVDAGEIAGILSVRDIVRIWTDDGAICELPQQPRVASADAARLARARCAQWSWSSGSSSMSRRVWRAHLTAVTRNSTPPKTISTGEIVMPTIAIASPAALSTGMMLGSGMWTCSPTGGASCSRTSAIRRCTPARRRRSGRT